MPKTLVGSHLVLLACLSLLAAHGLERTGPAPLALKVTAAALAAVMVVTEVFSGLRWVAVAAGAATAAGFVVPLAWGIGWLAVALWFAVLAWRQRRDR